MQDNRLANTGTIYPSGKRRQSTVSRTLCEIARHSRQARRTSREVCRPRFIESNMTPRTGVTNVRFSRRRRPLSPARRLSAVALVTPYRSASAPASVGSLAPALRYFLRSYPPRFGIAPLPSPTSQPKRQHPSTGSRQDGSTNLQGLSLNSTA